MLKIIPSIDIRHGRCVRLFQGDPSRETVYGEKPWDQAVIFERQGAERLHIVDLDGAFEGRIINWEVLAGIRKAVKMELEFSGGIRTMDDLVRLDQAGVERFVLGSVIVRDPDFFRAGLRRFGPKRVISGVDIKDGRLALKGWKDLVDLTLPDLLRRLEADGAGELVFTNIARDGTLTGPDLDMLRSILSLCGMDVVVSGGIGGPRDVIEIKNLKNSRVKGIILGKALYEKKIDLKALLQELRAGD